ncbi:MAG TPA: methyltransferase domain-containing protein [Candidatus Limnocylindrales bacterium]
MSDADPHQVVRDGYQVIAQTYHEGRASREQANIDWLDSLRPRLPQSGRVVDLGCGGGVPVSRYFANRGYEVEGYDLSPAMLDIARREVPSAVFREARMEDLDLEPASIDLIVSFFAIIHVPRVEHAALFTSMHTWLKPGGKALLSLGSGDNPSEYDPDWHGAPMSWSHFDGDTNMRLLREAGFQIEWSEIEEFGEGERHLFVIAERPA